MVLYAGMLVGLVDSAMGRLQDKPFWNERWEAAQLGIKIVWAILCAMLLGFVASVHSSHRGMVSFAAGILLACILLVWSIVECILLGMRFGGERVPTAKALGQFRALHKRMDSSEESEGDDHNNNNRVARNSSSMIFSSADVRLSLRSRIHSKEDSSNELYGT